MAISTTVAATINLFTDFLLIGLIGVYAAPISSLLGYLVISIWRVIDVNRRHCHIDIPKKKILTILLVLVMVLLGYYSANLYLQLCNAVLCTLVTFFLNRDMLIEFAAPILKRFM